MRFANLILIVFTIWLLTSCSQAPTDNANQNLPSEVIDMEPYWRGQRLYRAHCQNCHQESGEGIGKIYPPLAKSDFLASDKGRAIRIIKNGLNEKIMVNGQEFNNAMPNNVKLVDDDIAAIMTYIGNTWGNSMGNISKKEVREALSK